MGKDVKLMKEVICYIGVGSNLEEPREQVLRAIAALGNTENIRVIKVSSLYETKPVGKLDQPDFVNAVVKVGVKLTAFSLLRIMQDIELQQGRIRTGVRNGPRIIDLDLLLYGHRKIVSRDLIIPHPRMLERSFVLEPLAEIS
jgi:2-amino-4-hydroxy-6-hydroxymethyldihydropteridine diphosphokinase